MTIKKIKVLGAGGYGNVYLVKNTKTNKLYAEKKMFKNNINQKNYENEINILSLLKHNNIIKLYHYSESNKFYNIFLEYIENGTLEEFIQYNKSINYIPPDELIKNIIIQINNGLKYIHNNSIIHGDIKPGNILLTKNNKVKICDFGISQFISDIKTIISTPHFTAPELIYNTNANYNYIYAIDFWSLGCTIYNLITNELAFDSLGIYCLITKIKNCDYNINIVPEKYKKLIINLLKKDYIERYSSIDIDNYFNKNIDEYSLLELYHYYKKNNIINIIKNELNNYT